MDQEIDAQVIIDEVKSGMIDPVRMVGKFELQNGIRNKVGKRKF